ncbi:MAG: hypothetical protein HXX16_08745 [Bacteroidales bacterium]|nr:hypothetical protein [Bacteroidales bacterium]
MKRTLSIIYILLSLSTLTIAQKNFCEGYIITLNNDTIRGKVKDNFPFRLTGAPKKISFIDESGVEKSYLPKHIRGYSKADIANYVSIDIGFGKDFAKIIIDGEVSLLSYESTMNNSSFTPNGGAGGGTWSHSTSSTESFFLYRKKKGSIVEVTRFGFRELLAEYFSDYTELKEMIEKKELRYSDLEIIVEKYNRWKKKNKSSL